jgi:hypothetical protein
LSGTFATVDAGGLPITLEYGATGLTLFSSLRAELTPGLQTAIQAAAAEILQIIVTAGNISVSSASSGGTDNSSGNGELLADASSLETDDDFLDAVGNASGPTLTDPFGSVGGASGEFGGDASSAGEGAEYQNGNTASAIAENTGGRRPKPNYAAGNNNTDPANTDGPEYQNNNTDSANDANWFFQIKQKPSSCR